MAGNAKMIERKKEERAHEVEEDLRILAYARERDAKAQVPPPSLPSPFSPARTL